MIEDNPQNAAPESTAEPTILDLYKSVTRDWPSFTRFLRSLRDSDERLAVERAAIADAQVYELIEPIPEPEHSGRFPWRSLLALGLALLAQQLIEPPGSNGVAAVAVYLFAFSALIWSVRADEWRLAALKPEAGLVDPLTVRLIPLFLAIIFSVSAFFAFTDNRFTWLNVALWLAGIALFVWAVWMPRPAVEVRMEAAPRERWLWWAVFAAIFGLLIFFRFNRLDAIPVEPFSDHAEKILDVYDVSQGQTHIFFVRNSGREAFQMYWTLLVSWIFGTGLSFLSLKIGTALLGLLTLPYIYLLGKELGGPRAGLIALFLFGIAYWPNVISRIGLRFPLYPLFIAPVLFYVLRGLRTHARNDFLWCGLFLGVGLHGYSPIRIAPFVVIAAFLLYMMATKPGEQRRQATWWLLLVGTASMLVFLPLLRYAIEEPGSFSYRAFSRLGDMEQPLPAPVWEVFLSNLWNALRMFNWKDGEIWVNSIPGRPALDVVTGALFLLGVVLLIARVVRRTDWRDMFLLLTIPLLLMPSILSLAFPGENPALNRAGAAAIPAILIAALALDGLVAALAGAAQGGWRRVVAWSLAGMLLVASALQNYNLVFVQFDRQFRAGAWNTSEMGRVISDFRDAYGQTDTIWIVPFPHWVDTRLPGVWAGIPNRDFAMFRENLPGTLSAPYPKLFMFRPDDLETQESLVTLYPNGMLSTHVSAVPGKDFLIYFVEEQ